MPLTKEQFDRVKATMRRLMDFRRPYDTRRSLLYKQYIGQRDQLTFPDGVTPRSNTFAQYPWSNVETIVSRVHDAYFGYDEWFEVRPGGSLDGMAAEKMQIVLKDRIKAANIISAFEDLTRTVAIYGHGGLKVDWDWGYDTITYAQPVPAMDEMGQPIVDPNTGQPVILGMQPAVKQVPRNRPKFTPIDIYDLYVDPDGSAAAMVVDKTLGQLKQELIGYKLANPNAPEDLYYPEALLEIESRLGKEKDPDAVLVRVAELWDAPTNTVHIMTVDDRDSVAWKEARAGYRWASYRAFQRRVYSGPEVCLWTGPNPFNHKRIPILHTSYVRLPNEVFGVGAIEPIAEMTDALSRFINMIVDNWNLGINRRYVYDSNANIDFDSLKKFNTPGGMIAGEGDPNNVIRELPTHTPVAGDYSIIELYKALIEMTGGISDFYHKGTGSSGGNRTASGISNVISESNFKFRMFIRNLEVYVMQPALAMVASMIQQYLTDEFEVMITDEQPMIPKAVSVRPEELIGNFSFQLVAANYATNEVVRQRNVLAFANLAAQSPYLNEYEGLKMLAKIFKINDVDRVLKTPEQVAQEQQQAMMQQIQMQEMLANAEQRRQNEQIILSGAVNAHKERQKARAAQQNKAGKSQGQGGGRPRSRQFEGPIPGVDVDSLMREIGQLGGANAVGMGG